jgi:hypothetical protein
MKINNQINVDLYGFGLKRQKVYLVDNELIIIIAENKRIRALATLDSCGYPTTEINSILLKHFKSTLKERLQNTFKLKINTILKDYDSNTETASTVVILEEPIKNLII